MPMNQSTDSTGPSPIAGMAVHRVHGVAARIQSPIRHAMRAF